MAKPDDNLMMGELLRRLEDGVRYVVERSASLCLDDEQDRESLIEAMPQVLLSFILADEPGCDP